MTPRERSGVLLLLAVLAARSYGFMRPIKIGGIFHKGDEDYMLTFAKAIAETKNEQTAPEIELVNVTVYIEDNTDSFRTGIAVCELLKEGVAAIFGPASPYTRGIVASIAAKFHIPHIEYVWRENEGPPKDRNSTTINFFPDAEMISQAIADITGSMGWRNFIAIYEDNDGLSRLQKTLTIKRDKKSPITIRQLGEGSDYRSMLKEIRSLPVCNIIIDVNPDKLTSVLKQAKEDSPKMPVIYEIRSGTDANITGLNLRENDIEGINSINSAILYDAVFMVKEALEVLNARSIPDDVFIDPVPIVCQADIYHPEPDFTNNYHAGSDLGSTIKEISKTGKMTGMMDIDDSGHRQGFKIQILNFRQPELSITELGSWDSESGVQLAQAEKDLESFWNKSIQEKTFKIITKIGPPYIMEVKDSNRGIMIDKKYYEGYCIELIEMIAKKLNFKYEFVLTPDNAYGKYDDKTKSWNGLIGRLLSREADLAICDLTITYERESAVDFTIPFMNLGISILFAQPEPENPDLFSFLNPLSADVWIFMATAYLIVSLMLFFQARMAPGEWDNPHPCNPDPEELENNFDLKNSLWLTIGSLMQQGSDILPKAPSIRMLTSMWWFFTLIMISSYTANLAAFLTSVKMDTPINSVEDLAKQTKISYGCITGGSTYTFFRDSNYSTYKRIFTTMNDARPSVFTLSNEEGVDRVLKSKRTYAFFMESTTIEYKMERQCDLDKIGGLLDNKGYGIALPRNSPYRTLINAAILQLSETGTLAVLKTKWWKEMGGGLCEKDESDKSGSSMELRLANVGGVFLVLGVGCAASCFIAICEFLWNARQVAVKEKITPWEAFVAEVKFTANIWAVTKPVKIAQSSGTSSMEGGLGRAASAARSFVGSFIRLDMADKYDKDRNTNSRGNDRKNN